MKKLVGSVVTLAVVVLGSYYGTGLITERTLKKDMDMINQTSGLSVDMVSYDRGLFTSKVNVTWQMHAPERLIKNQQGDSTLVPSKTYTFDMPITIYHGPVSYAGKRLHFGLGYAESKLVLPSDYREQFNQYFDSKSTIPTMDVSLYITYLNETHLHLDVPAFQLTMKKDNSQFEWLGMSSDHHFTSSMSHVDGELTMNGMRVTNLNNKTLATLDSVTATYNLHQSLADLYLGEVTINVPSVVVTQDGKVQFEAKALHGSSQSDVDKGLFGSVFKASFDKIIAQDKHYDAGQIEFAIKNLDAQILADMNEKTNQMHEDTDTERQQALLTLLPDLPKLFSKGATIELSQFHVGLPAGPVDGQVRITLPKEEMGNPFQMIQKIAGQGHVKIPVPVLKEWLLRSAKEKLMEAASSQSQAAPEEAKAQDAPTPASDANSVPVVSTPDTLDQQAVALVSTRITDLIKAGALVQSGSDYVIDVKLDAGQFLVNGHPFNTGMLQF
jgi:uncharacterized protein YdgA (DUF945 family)